jgi:HAD superfamily hydrolase (TIGR01490 family)
MTHNSPQTDAAPVRLAIYDMDKTITRAPTWTPFLWHSAGAWRRALLPIAGVAAAGYGMRLMNRGRLKQVTQRLMLGRMTQEGAARAADRFADRLMTTGVLAAARARIAADRAAGYRLVMATASYRFYVEAIAHRLGFDAVIGTESVRDARGRIRARIDGENCYGPAKLRMIEAWMAREGIDRGRAHVRFYSDHVSDVPALAWADEAFAVNAHGPLRSVAKARGWPLLDWTD